MKKNLNYKTIRKSTGGITLIALVITIKNVIETKSIQIYER